VTSPTASPGKAHTPVNGSVPCNTVPNPHEVNRLRTQLEVISRQRVADEDEANRLPQLMRAILLNGRDRDAGVNQQLRGHRAHLERICADAEELVIASMQTAVRIHLHGGGDDDPVVQEARRALRHGQAALRRLSDAFLEV
jgi:hypothetical protein